jgi:Tol biopolymer transport system component
VLGLRRGPESRKSVRFFIAPPEGTKFQSFAPSMTLALSPDGSSLAFVATAGGRSARETSLYVRPFDALAAIPLKGTEGAVSPFWSPDGRSIGFFAQGKLQKIAAGGGPPQALCDSVFGNAAVWGRDGMIHYWEWGGGREGIYRVSAEGGTPAQITSYDRAREGGSPAWPVFLADRRQFLYLAGVFGSKEPRRLWAASPGFEQRRPLMAMDSRVAYCDPGYLIFVRDGSLLAQPFDAKALRVTGDPIPVSDDVWFHRATGNAAFSVSENGTLAYAAGSPPSRLAWRDRSGHEIGTVGGPAVFNSPRLSPDGTRVAVSVVDPRRGVQDIWIYDALRGIAQRFTADPADAGVPVWSPEGDRIVFGSAREAPPDLYVKRVDGAGGEEVLLKRTGTQFPSDWSPDGKRIVYSEASPGGAARRSLWVTAVGATGESTPLLRTNFSVFQARYSPDGRWIAFVSEESGRPEIHVAPAHPSGGSRRVSVSGGAQPRWRRDGRELFYLAPNGDLVSVPAGANGEIPAGSPEVLFTMKPVPEDYDVSADGSRFLLQERGPDTPVTVVVNWAGGLRK